MKRKILSISLLLFVTAIFSVWIEHIYIGAKGKNTCDITIAEMVQEKEKKGRLVAFYFQDSCEFCTDYWIVVEEATKQLNAYVPILCCDQMMDSTVLENYGIQRGPALVVVRDGHVKGYEGPFDLETTKRIISYGYEDDETKGRLPQILHIPYEHLSKKLLESKDFLLYIGRQDCFDCQSFYPILEENISADENIEVYYFDIKELRDGSAGPNAQDENIEKYEWLKQRFDIQWVPSLYRIMDGVIVSKYEYLSEDYYAIEDEKVQTQEREKFLQEFNVWMDLNS